MTRAATGRPSPLAQAAWAGLLPLLLLAPAVAQGDRKPVIKEIQDGSNQRVTRAPQGGNIRLMGRNFHQCPPMPEGANPKKWRCEHKDLKVTVAGQKAFVVDVTFDYVSIIIPQGVRPAKRVRVEVSISRRGSAHASLEVVDNKTWKASAGERGQEGGGGKDMRERTILSSFKITRFAQVRTPAGDTFQVEGIAKVPNGLRVELKLCYEGQTIPKGTRLVTVKDAAFQTTFGPYSKQLLCGNYSADLMFQLGKQSKRKRKKFERTLNDEDRELYGRIFRRELTQIGTGPGGTLLPEDRKRQASRLRAHYLEFTSEILKVRDQMLMAVADAGRSFFKTGREYDKAEYTRWLLAMGFAKDTAAAEKVMGSPRYGTASGHFKAREYRQWADLKFIPKVKSLYTKHRHFNDRYLCPIDAKADTLGDWLLSIVIQRFQEYSRDLYKHSKLPLPDSIGVVPVSPIRAPKLSRKFFDAKRRELMRKVGLDKYVKDGE